MAAQGKAEGAQIAFPKELAAGRTVRVVVPAKVAFNLDQMQGVTADILNRLGCPTCHSGFDIRFFLEQDFIVNEQGQVRGGFLG